jgi:small subunit ribosomal protein S2
MCLTAGWVPGGDDGGGRVKQRRKDMSVVSMKALLEAGVHFGHRTRRWNPKMRQYIFTERNGIHIIDLQQTISRLDQAYNLVRDTVADGGIVLFTGTKRQAQDTIVEEATRCGMPYVEQRWLGGTLTNWRTIRQRIDYLLDLEKKQMRGEFARLPKKEVGNLEYEIARLNRRLGGLKDMRRLPNLLFVVDVRREAIAVKEANILGIPVIAMVDTNCDPDPIDYIIPSNDDAIRAIRLMLSTTANAVIEGTQMRETMLAEEEEAEAAGEVDIERYLGPSTLAKLRAAEDGEEDEEVEADEEEELSQLKRKQRQRPPEEELAELAEEDAEYEEIESTAEKDKIVEEDGGEDESSDEESEESTEDEEPSADAEGVEDEEE